MFRRCTWNWALLALASWLGFSSAAEETYDVVIRGGKVVNDPANP